MQQLTHPMVCIPCPSLAHPRPRHREAVDRFLEELVVRRELAENFCEHCPNVSGRELAEEFCEHCPNVDGLKPVSSVGGRAALVVSEGRWARSSYTG